MEFLYYLTGLTLLGVMGAGIIGLIKPKLFTKPLKQHATRGKITLISIAAFFLLGGALSATEPESIKQQRLLDQQSTTQQQVVEEQPQLQEAPEPKVEQKTVTKTEQVDFQTETKDDSSLPSGQTKVIQHGEFGIKTFTYSVTYTNGIETDRELISEEITTNPTTKIVAKGTYVAPAAPTQTSGDGYTNSQGNYVPSPSSDPTGATARCRDGTYSYSQSRRGTCSHHGGVAEWL